MQVVRQVCKTHEILLRSRRGVEFPVLVGVMLPLIMVIFSVALDGSALAMTAHRARGVAMVAAQAGATQVDFAGRSPTLKANACEVALASAFRNTNGGNRAIPSCATQGQRVTVGVAMRVPKLFAFSVWFPDYVRMQHIAEPKYGINVRE